jgi:hypothetical protein
MNPKTIERPTIRRQRRGAPAKTGQWRKAWRRFCAGCQLAGWLLAGLPGAAAVGEGVWALSLVPGSQSDAAGAIPLVAVPVLVLGLWWLARIAREIRRWREAQRP